MITFVLITQAAARLVDVGSFTKYMNALKKKNIDIEISVLKIYLNLHG